ncbi:MAG: dTMP kinase [Pedobacter sp.]
MSSFISFEGIEGSGKTTQIQLLANRLESLGYEVLITREPGGCPIADQIRHILLHPDNDRLVPGAELLLYAAARAQHVSEVITPALEQGKIVLCDRYCDATLAYQGYARGLDLQLVQQLNDLAAGTCRPNLTLLLDMLPDHGLHRAQSRNAVASGPAEGRFEQESLIFHSKVRQGYLDLAQQEPQRIKVIDATGTQEQVAKRIWQTTSGFLNCSRSA